MEFDHFRVDFNLSSILNKLGLACDILIEF